MEQSITNRGGKWFVNGHPVQLEDSSSDDPININQRNDPIEGHTLKNKRQNILFA